MIRRAGKAMDMRLVKDPVFLLLAGLLIATLLLFILGFIPYPVGVLVLLAFLVARILFKT